MKQSEAQHGRPDEDRLRLPARWRRHVLPRRGRDLANTAADTEIDPGASETVARRIATMRPQLDEGIGKRQNTSFATPMRDHLQSRANPAGAAALMHLLESTGKQTVDPAARMRHLDAWITDHGLAFATVAVLESAMVYNLSYATDQRSITDGNLNSYVEWEQPKSWRQAQPAVNRIRSLLASAPEPTYRDVAAAIGAHRTDPQRLVGAAILMPTEPGWAEAFEALTGYFQSRHGDDWMRWSFAADPRHWELVRSRGIDIDGLDERALAPLIEGIGTTALPILTDTLDRAFARLSKPARAALMTAIGLLPTDDATGYLVDKLALPGALTAMMEVAERFPARTIRVIAARAAGADPAARARLAGVVNSSPALADALTSADDEVRRAVAALLDVPDKVPEAPADALPPLLVAPPWKTKGRKAAPTVVEGLAPTLETRVIWGDDEEAQHWATLLDDDPYDRLDAKEEARALAYFEKHGQFRDPMGFFAWATVEAAESKLEGWDGTGKEPNVWELMRILGRFGPRAADRVSGLAKGRNALGKVLMPIQNLVAARSAADRLSRSKSMRPLAKQWLDRHAAAAAQLLIPDALGTDRALRRAANTALRYLIAFHGNETVSAAAKEYGEAAAAAIDAFIAADPLDPLDAKIPKPPSWAAPTMLPQVLLEGRKAALPPASVGHLITVLALDTPELPYAGVEVITETCDEHSLTRLSWTLFELWAAAGSPSKDGWAFTQLARFADDGTVRELAAMIREWPGEGQHKRAVTGLEILGAIGSETSLRALHLIARKVGFKALKQEANRQIEAVAEHLGLSTEQLADRLVPDFGLDGETSLVLDYGPRRFKVGFDEQLKPFVTAEDGKPLKSLPKPGGHDNKELAEAAYRRFAELKKELRTVAKEQVRRLELAMVQGRAWNVPEFKEYFTDHPLMRHLARRLVWQAESDGDRFAFRLAEDSSLTDVEEDVLELPDGALIRLAHPVALGERLADWTEILADYEILQPFAQLARPVKAFTERELTTGRIARFEGATIEVGRIFGLIHSGWRRGPSNSLWVEPGVHFPLPGGGFVMLALDPGIDGYLGSIDSSQPDQTVRAAYLSATVDYGVRGEHRDHPGEHRDHPTDIDPVTASEVLGALTRVTKTA